LNILLSVAGGVGLSKRNCDDIGSEVGVTLLSIRLILKIVR